MLDEAGLVEGRIISEASLERFVHELNNYYVSMGRYGSEGRVGNNASGSKSRRVVDIQIEEGRVARVREIRFVGNTAFEDACCVRSLYLTGTFGQICCLVETSSPKKSWIQI